MPPGTRPWGWLLLAAAVHLLLLPLGILHFRQSYSFGMQHPLVQFAITSREILPSTESSAWPHGAGGGCESWIQPHNWSIPTEGSSLAVVLPTGAAGAGMRSCFAA